jgi:putative endonuclease
MFIRLLEVADTLRHYGRRREWADGHAIGRRGEDIAQRFLQRQGMTIVARNYRMESGAGEIDLIAWDCDKLVFIEVKTRQTEEFGAPDRAIGPGKQRTMLRAARDYARHAEVAWDQVRFDVVGVVLRRPPAITHFQNVLL